MLELRILGYVSVSSEFLVIFRNLGDLHVVCEMLEVQT